MDSRQRLLTRAAEIWQLTLTADAGERLDLAHELVEMKIFSNRQIAKIARVSTTTLTRRVGQSESGGGRFDPATLSGLAIIREAVVEQTPLPLALIRGIVEGGTSLSNLCRLTGAPRATLYGKFKED